MKKTLTLALSHPMGEGTRCQPFPISQASRSDDAGWTHEQKYAPHRPPSPIGWERAGVRVPFFPSLRLCLSASLRYAVCLLLCAAAHAKPLPDGEPVRGWTLL